jgi:uncharacterized protein
MRLPDLQMHHLLAAALVVANAAGGGAASAPASTARASSPWSRAAAQRAFADAARAEVRFPGGRVIAAQIADTPERIMYGYMFREEVREDDGMVFVFPSPGAHQFWMKNTLVPLDIIWMDADRTILHIEKAVPPCRADPCPGYGTMRLVSFVLETRSGTADREGLKTGDRMSIVFPGEAGDLR